MEMSEKREAEKGGVRAYGPMVIAALAVRLAVIPFLYHEWLDPFVLEHWAFGRLARSSGSGARVRKCVCRHGTDSGATPGVRVFAGRSVPAVWDRHTGLPLWRHWNSLFSALTCIPVFLLARRCFNGRVAKWAGWGWAFSPYGIYYGADWAQEDPT